jgi:hypothetical protein
MAEPQRDKYAIPRLMKVGRNGLNTTHAARAENGVVPEHVIPGAPPPEVLFNAAPDGMTFKEFVLESYNRAIKAGLVYRPRRDQVLAVEGLLTASPEFFRPECPDQAGVYTLESVRALRERGLLFLRQQYGDQLIRAELQLDEVTPHIQFAFFPIDERGQWSAKNCMQRRKLFALWTSWAAATKDLGLKRGVPGSKARHEPIKKYYAAVRKFDQTSVKAAKAIAIVPPQLPAPSRATMFNPADYISGVNKQLAVWGQKETKRILKLLQPLIAASADAELTRRRARQERLTVERQAGKISTLETNLEMLDLDLRRSEPVPVAAVADRIGYPGTLDLRPYRNAVEFLERFEGLDADQSIGWLNAEFGPEAAAATAADLVRSNTIADAATLGRPKIQTIEELKLSLKAQLVALDADEFRLLSRTRGKPASGMSDLCVPGTECKSWVLEDVLAAIARLKTWAAVDEIRIVPVNRRYSYLLVADLKSPTVLVDAGIHPCNVVQLGPDRYEAILRISEDMTAAELKKIIGTLQALHVKGPREVGSRFPIHLAGFRSEDAEERVAIELVHADDVDCLAGKNMHPDGVAVTRPRIDWPAKDI